MGGRDEAEEEEEMTDKDYMRLAFKIARRAKGFTNPNPLVGCLIVKEGKIIGKGFHKKTGLPHAEIEALREAKEKAEGASLYVNLEPCRHYGRTPPCTEAIIKAGIKKVYTALLDPNPLNNGKGVEELRRNGIEVDVGILEDEARRLNEVFIKYITQKNPFVSVKIAESLDGKIATGTGESKWITSEKARAFAKKLRNEVDAIMVGVNTIIKDNPLLNYKLQITKSKLQMPKLFYKIVLDSRLNTPMNARIFSKDSIGKIIIVTTRRAPESRIDLLRTKAEVLVMKDKNGKIDLRELMKELARREISHVLIEGGGETIASALEAEIVDKVLFFIAPKIIGGRKAITSVEGEGIEKLHKAIQLKEVEIKRIGEDFLISGYLRKEEEEIVHGNN